MNVNEALRKLSTAMETLTKIVDRHADYLLDHEKCCDDHEKRIKNLEDWKAKLPKNLQNPQPAGGGEAVPPPAKGSAKERSDQSNASRRLSEGTASQASERRPERRGQGLPPRQGATPAPVSAPTGEENSPTASALSARLRDLSTARMPR
jgi:hypothetical protein